jgi:ubiquinone/menaquinone biosynthesis C-methylase UbiE
MKQSAETAAALSPLLEHLPCTASAPGIPEYLETTYWWAYLHPNAVRFFEREWLVNLILWGNFRKLRDLALLDLGEPSNQRILQVACVYGDFTQQIVARMGAGATLDVIDVAPIQLDNLRSKLPPDARVRLHHQDASDLQFPDAGFDSTLLFFLLHEQPEDIRRATLAEAVRVTRPGGKIIIVDYHKPKRSNPLRYLMKAVLTLLEPFARDLWRKELDSYLPANIKVGSIAKTCHFGDLYQKVVIYR